MKNNNPYLILLLAILGIAFISSVSDSKIVRNDRSFFTQADFMDDLANPDLDMTDAKEVFRYVFARLNDEETIYQSENNLYLRFAANGKVFGGIITLAILTRDEGVISLSYIERNENPNIGEDRNKVIGGGASFTAKDGMIVKKVDDWTYKVTFEGRSVLFHLYHLGMQPPQKAKLLPVEEYVGPVFDEAGIEMYLVFNREVSRLYLILNEDLYVRDTFTDIGDNVLIGQRTSFAFYDDTENNRKILIGVRGENTIQNNWYDGPHDQMPDNYVHLGYIPKYLEYLESNYPSLKGQMDKYGHFLGRESGRIAVAPYNVYFEEQELKDISKACKTQGSKSKVYDCLTLQIYDIPDDKQYLLGY